MNDFLGCLIRFRAIRSFFILLGLFFAALYVAPRITISLLAALAAFFYVLRLSKRRTRRVILWVAFILVAVVPVTIIGFASGYGIVPLVILALLAGVILLLDRINNKIPQANFTERESDVYEPPVSQIKNIVQSRIKEAEAKAAQESKSKQANITPDVKPADTLND